MSRSLSLSALLACTTGLAAAPALADCEITPTGFVCTGVDPDGVVDLRPDVSGEVQDDARVETDGGDTAIRVSNGAFVRNGGEVAASGLIVEAGDGLTLSNDGTMVTFGSDGIFAGDGVTIDNAGQIQAEGAAIRTADDLELTNVGDISAVSPGVEAGDRASVTNTGTISGGFVAGVDAGDELTIFNDGRIEGDVRAIRAGDVLRLSNFGVISSDTQILEAGDDANISNDGDGEMEGLTAGITASEGLEIRNEGRITSRGAPTVEAGRDLDLVNIGRIENFAGDAVQTAGGRINNSFVISAPGSAAGGAGVVLRPRDGVVGALGVINEGLIQGRVGVEDLSSPLGATILNENGVIDGTNGPAIDLDLGADLVTLSGGGSLILGDVNLGRGADALTLTDGALIVGAASLGGGDDRLTGDRSLFEGSLSGGPGLFAAGFGDDEAIFEGLSVAEVDFEAIPGGFLIALKDDGIARRFTGFEQFVFTDTVVVTEVSPVPLPAGAALLGGALMLLGAARRQS